MDEYKIREPGFTRKDRTMNTATLAPPPVALQPSDRGNRPKKRTPPVTKLAHIEPAIETPTVGSTVTDRSKIIIARVNVGWGNTVYLRGEGGPLNWDVGEPMVCTGDDRWVWSCHAEELPRQFKFLRNDQVWALGDNQAVSGADITVCSPRFPE
jgi:hypothetical protein